jgi:2-methylisocitrate lyase-like PEP mutase family enzyme
MGSHDDPAVLLAREDMVVGEIDEVIARLRAYAAAGVERVFLQHIDFADLEMVRLIAEEIVPAVA